MAITIDSSKVVRQIKDSNNVVYTIDAPLWEGRRFSEIESMIHGVVDTYVIPSQDSETATSDYKTVVGSVTAQVSTKVSALNALTSSSTTNTYKVGDIILMGATSDGTKNFDRWVSKVSGTGVSAIVYLDVLETQVAKHHHTIDVPTITSSTATVLTSAKVGTTTTSNMAYAGSEVTVVTGASNKDDVVITSVSYDSEGTYDLNIATGESKDYGHTHTVDSHNHTVTYTKTTVSRNADAYTVLSTSSYTPHTHTVVSVAGEAKSDETITYATGGAKSTASFIKTLTDASTTTNTGEATPGTSEEPLTTSTQVSTDEIGNIVNTQSAGSHSHTVTTTTDAAVVTSVTVAAKVVTSVSYSAAKTVTSWTTTVDASGILSFNVPTSDRISSITIPSRADQKQTSGKVTSTGTAVSAGAHHHGFSHTHTIAAHSHAVDSHVHTYKKTVVSETESAITSLTTSSYNMHKHTNISVASTSTDSTPIPYVYGGDTTSVVRDLTINENASATVGLSSPGTNKVHQKITGTITHPAVSYGYKKLSDMLSTTTVIPAVDSGEKPAMSIATSTKNVVESVSVDTSSVKTSPNVGGE